MGLFTRMQTPSPLPYRDDVDTSEVKGTVGRNSGTGQARDARPGETPRKISNEDFQFEPTHVPGQYQVREKANWMGRGTFHATAHQEGYHVSAVDSNKPWTPLRPPKYKPSSDPSRVEQAQSWSRQESFHQGLNRAREVWN